LLEWQDADPPPGRKLVGLDALQVGDDRRQVGICRGLADARFQPPEQVDELDAFDDPSPLESDGDIDVGAAPHEPLRHDADHGA
jgi:hypothetical protein